MSAAVLWLLVGIVAGGAAFRIRGWGGFEQITGRGATTARLLWGAVGGVLAWASWAQPAAALAIGAGLFVGSVAPWWRSLSLGADPADGPATGQYLRHFARGVLFPLPAALLLALPIPLLGFPPWWAAVALAVSGLACVPAYQAGKILGVGTPVGELLFGGAMGAAIVLPGVIRGG